MDTFEYSEVLGCDCKVHYNAMAFDGCYYYFTVRCQKKIIKTDMNFCVKDCYETCREYDSICYDQKDCCFWATSSDCSRKIYKLSSCFSEADNIFAGSNVVGISYNCCDDKLLVAFAGEIVELNKCNGEINVKQRIKCGCITAVLSICPGYIITVLKDNKQFAYAVDYDDRIVNICNISTDYLIRSMIFDPCKKKCKCGYIRCFAMKKSCYPFILSHRVQPRNFGFYPCECNYRIGEKCCEKCCNECCNESCERCCEHEPCSESDCTDVMRSIAQVETAISHILTAEGDKIQKVLAQTDDIEQILSVNRAVNRTIVNATHLEQVLYDKLASLSNCCDLCEDK